MSAANILFFLSAMTFQFHDALALDESFNLPRCDAVQTSIENDVRRFEIAGTWLSKRCEVRPGPQYVLRFYTFRYDGKFNLHHHFYKDGNCSIPLSTVTSQGKLRLNSIRNSLRVRGAKDVNYTLKKVNVQAHTKRGGKRFRKILRTKCPFCLEQYYVSRSTMTFPVYRASSNCDCLETIDFYLGELKIMKVIERSGFEKSSSFESELYVGNVKSVNENKRYFSSSTLQDPLVKVKKNSKNCEVCAKMLLATNLKPPRLEHREHEDLKLSGNWNSVRCEVRPGSIFLTRHLIFLSDATSWEGKYSYFQDPECSRPTYSIKVGGRLSIDNPSSKVSQAFDATFSVSRLLVTSQNEKVTKIFNSYREGAKESMVTNKEMNVTMEGNFDAIGLYLPHKEYELLKIATEDNKRLLFTGRRPTGGASPDAPNNRATSFQDELIMCQDSSTTNILASPSKSRWISPKQSHDNVLIVARIVLQEQWTKSATDSTTARFKGNASALQSNIILVFLTTFISRMHLYY